MTYYYLVLTNTERSNLWIYTTLDCTFTEMLCAFIAVMYIYSKHILLNHKLFCYDPAENKSTPQEARVPDFQDILFFLQDCMSIYSCEIRSNTHTYTNIHTQTCTHTWTHTWATLHEMGICQTCMPWSWVDLGDSFHKWIRWMKIVTQMQYCIYSIVPSPLILMRDDNYYLYTNWFLHFSATEWYVHFH